MQAAARALAPRISRSSYQRILAAGELRPHRVRGWLHSPDSQFRVISDLYLHPPEGAVVLSIDEKTGMQALEPRFPDRPADPGGRDGGSSSTRVTGPNRCSVGLRCTAADDADALRRAIHALGDYGHVSVLAARGHLTIHVDDGVPVAWATPLGAGQFGLSFHTHTGRWEPMPVVVDLTRLAHDLVGLLGPYLQRWDFPDRNSGSDPLAPMSMDRGVVEMAAIKRQFEAHDLPESIGALVRRSAELHGDAIVGHWFDANIRLTYRELNEAADRLAASLVGIGVRKGAHVAVLLPNLPAFPSAGSRSDVSAPSWCRSTPLTRATRSRSSSTIPMLNI